MDTVSSPGNEFHYFVCIAYTYLTMGALTMADGLFVQLAINIKGHFRIFQRNIKEANFVYKQDNSPLLKDIVKTHIDLLDVCDQLNEVFMPILFPVCVIIAGLAGMVAYLLAREFELMNIIVNLGYLSIVLVQLLFYCYGSQVITTEVSSKILVYYIYKFIFSEFWSSAGNTGSQAV